jgi:DNA polymerase I
MSSHKYKILNSKGGLEKYLPIIIKGCKHTKYCSFDFESTGGAVPLDDFKLTMIGISFQPGFAYIIPLAHNESTHKKNWLDILRLFAKEVLMDKTIVKVSQNCKYEIKCLMRFGLDYDGFMFDTMLAKYLLKEERPNDLGSIVRMVFDDYHDYKDDTEQLAKKAGGWAAIPLLELSKRCALDSDLTLRLAIYFEPKLIKLGFYKLFRNLLIPDTKVLAESEFHGFHLDIPHFKKLDRLYTKRLAKMELKMRKVKQVRIYEKYEIEQTKKELIAQLQKELEDKKANNASPKVISNHREKLSRIIAGNYTTNKEKALFEPINFNSPTQLKDLFFYSKKGFKFDVFKFTKGKDKKPTDNASTDEETLLALEKQDKTGFIKTLLELRGLSTLHGTFVKGILERQVNGKIYPNFMLHTTVTGRLSSTNPNCQNIPRTTTNKDIKRGFLPPPGYLLLEVDYSQAELRIVAELAEDKAMIEIFKKGYNIHVATACKVYKALDRYDEIKKIIKIGENMEPKDLIKPENKDYLFWVKAKKKAKTINFGILYGQGIKKLAEGMGATEQEAQKFMDEWFKAYPQVTVWIKKQQAFAKKNGYVYNIFGRKRRLPDAMYSEREAKNDKRIGGLRAEALRQSVNAPIQGGSSDICQLAAVEIYEERRQGKLPFYMRQIYTVHDSLGYPILPEDIHEVVPKIIKICSNPNIEKWFGFKLKHVDMKVSPEIGIHWADLGEWDPNKDYTKVELIH